MAQESPGLEGPEPGDLAADTAVTGLDKAPGWFVADLPPAWDFATPSGGVLMTVALRAMLAEIGEPELRPIGAHALFLSPVPNGALEVRVEVLRRGNAAVQARAALSSTDRPGPGLEVSATFGRELDGPAFTDSVMPAVTMPDAAPPEPPRRADRFVPPFIHNYDIVHGGGPPIWDAEHWPPGEAWYARWFRHRVPQFLDDGRLDPLVVPPIADTMVPAVAAAIGSDRDFYAPSLDLTVHFLGDTRSDWLLTSSRSRRARAGYATADCEIWSADGDLVAYATQTMIIRKPLDL
ncbi:MAG: thioesterase family protein [Acidimicrobiia bacterium]|nr:thioesterase family protein [Acidimicrobiia bacterium]